jgi:hypothetical protein
MSTAVTRVRKLSFCSDDPLKASLTSSDEAQ